MSRRTRLRAAGIVALVAAAGCRKEAGGAGQPPPRPIEVLTMAPSELREAGQYLGSLLSRGSVPVRPQVAGYVRKIEIRPGQQVSAGDVLVEIDAREENAALTSAGAQAESARASLALARKSLARAEALHRDGLVSGQ